MNTENEFYTSISEYYDYIFPYNPKQMEFIKSITEEQEIQNVLDIGCGTGNLALEMAKEGYEVYGVDSDTHMIATALDKKRGLGFMQSPRFRELDMEKLSKFFSSNKFDVASCFGNTLPHLLTFENIEEFLKSVSIVLQSGAHFAIQILNYDYILDNQIEELPLKETDDIRFERYYEYPDNSELIDFRTKLTLKNMDQVIENQISLFPVGRSDLKSMLEEAGFKNIEFYSDFNKSPYKKDSYPLIVDCHKK